MITFLLAKQSFMNYYLLSGSALLLAGISWPEDDPRRVGAGDILDIESNDAISPAG
jgi:hypothetical protein